MRYYIADTHFFHENLLGNSDFSPRPFKDIYEMNDVMVDSWCSRVKENDEVFHLGDIAFHPDYEGGYPEIFQLLNHLPGKITFIKGNHDPRSLFNYLNAQDRKGKFSFHDVGMIQKLNHHQFFLTHYPLLLGISKNSINLHGHIHHSMVPLKENINVGVDAPERDFLKLKLPFGAPISENEILELMGKKREHLQAEKF